MKRLFVTAMLMGIVVSACSPTGTGPNPDAPVVEPTTSSTGTPTPASSPPTAGGEVGERSALELFAGANVGKEYPDDLPPPTIDTSELLRGQIPDGIPAIDEPGFVSIAEADAYLSDEEGVIVLDIEGDARAYPVQILIWHEIVNDSVGGVPVSITYCPLCNSAVSYRRIVQGQATTFGTSGLLFNSALVMYDRLTESLWTHYNGEAVAGLVTGERLTPISSPLLGWKEFKEAFPDGLVLDRENTGHTRSYGTNPYPDYDDPTGFPFLYRGEVNDRIGAQQRVTGVSLDGVAKAWTLEAISGGVAQATNDSVGDRPVVLFWKAGQATALESGRIDGGRDVGSVGVFIPESGGQALTFTTDGASFIDNESGSTWSVLGEASAGPLAGARLVAVPHLDTFWFAWFSYNPGTVLVGG